MNDLILKNTNPILPPDETGEIASALKDTMPEEYLVPIDILSNRMTRYDFFSPIKLDAGKLDIYASFYVIDDDLNKYKIYGPKFTEFDRAVNDALISCYIKQIKMKKTRVLITSAMIARVLNGDLRSEYQGRVLIDDIFRSMEKLNVSKGAIGYIDPVTRQPIGNVTAGSFVTYETIIDRQLGPVFEISGIPLMLRHAQMMGQIESVPIGIMNILTSDSTEKSKYTSTRKIAIKMILLRQILIMKRSNGNQSHHLLFESLLVNMDPCKNYTRQEKRAIKDYVVAVLNSWQSAGFISGFEGLKNDRHGKFRGFHIYLPRDSRPDTLPEPVPAATV